MWKYEANLRLIRCRWYLETYHTRLKLCDMFLFFKIWTIFGHFWERVWTPTLSSKRRRTLSDKYKLCLCVSKYADIFQNTWMLFCLMNSFFLWNDKMKSDSLKHKRIQGERGGGVGPMICYVQKSLISSLFFFPLAALVVHIKTYLFLEK